MGWVDAVIIFILAGCAWRGLSAGLIKAVGDFIGIFGGVFAASHSYLWLFGLIGGWFGGLNNIGKIICFIALFLLASRLIYFLFILLDKTYNLLSIIPFLKSINRLAGGVLGLFVGALALGLIIYVAAKYTAADGIIGNWIISSKVAPGLLVVAKILLPVISGSLKDIKSIL
jgi:uncharacterized membrane protein required for colicin V production